MSGSVVDLSRSGDGACGASSGIDALPSISREFSGVAWDALNLYSGAWVMLIRQDGILVHANDSVLGVFGGSIERSIGRSVCELIPESICADRLAFYDRVMREQRPLFVEGIIGGSMVRCALRPIPPATPGGPSHVLCICRPVGPTSEPCPQPRVRAGADDWGPLSGLTDREMEVLRLIGRGMTTAQIAKEMHRSVKTIEWHRVSLGAKLGAANRVDLARMAIHFGLAGPLAPSIGARALATASPMALMGDAPK